MMEKRRPLEYCSHCGGPTGKAGQGDGSLYCECDAGPFCDDCWKEHHQGNVLAFKLVTVESQRTELLGCLQGAVEYFEADYDQPPWFNAAAKAIARVTGKEQK